MSAEQRRPLAQLVHDRNDRWSYREMSSRAQKAGHTISHSQLADYANDTVKKVPSREQIEALASALDLGAETVRAAVFEQFYGYIPRELGRGARASKIMAAIPTGLTPEDEEELARMIEAWVAVRRRNPAT